MGRAPWERGEKRLGFLCHGIVARGGKESPKSMQSHRSLTCYIMALRGRGADQPGVWRGIERILKMERGRKKCY